MSSHTKLHALEKRCYACRACPLHRGDQRVSEPHVFGHGNIDAEVVIVGQNPGYRETITKKPFIGRSGETFDRMLQERVGLQREQVYVTNIVKCYTTGNRAPRADEIKACKIFLLEELHIIQPKIVVVLGNSALSCFTGSNKIADVHGQILSSASFDAKIYPIYHPSPMNMNKSSIRLQTEKDLAKLKTIIA